MPVSKRFTGSCPWNLWCLDGGADDKTFGSASANDSRLVAPSWLATVGVLEEAKETGAIVMSLRSHASTVLQDRVRFVRSTLTHVDSRARENQAMP